MLAMSLQQRLRSTTLGRPGAVLIVHKASRTTWYQQRGKSLDASQRQVKAHSKASNVLAHTTWLRRGLADGPDSPFYELRLDERIRNAGGGIRHRNYSNLFKPAYQQPAAPIEDWSCVYADPSKPLVIDVGCGSGRYVLLMAYRDNQQHAGNNRHNYLGLDIHKALMDRANGWVDLKGLQHCVHYHCANAAISLPSLLSKYPGPVHLVSVQYPDPHIHKDRHVVQEGLVRDLEGLLHQGAHVLLQSDLQETAEYMRDTFERYGSHAFDLDPLHHVPGATFQAVPAPEPAARTSSWEAAAAVAVARAAQHATASSVQPAAAAVAVLPGRSSGELEQSQFEPGASAGPPLGGWPPRGRVLGHTGLVGSAWAKAGWLIDNPVGVPTEREVYVNQVTHGKLYRVYLRRT
mmetsp:Transcript_13820/g.29821  ORF Transcript_13820/g.29821 Transcript_13820/m.29821 type:complete len:405 (+) Transcript_13820:91-1305(+)